MKSDLKKFEGRIGYCFKDQRLIEQALTHSSFAYEAEESGIKNNEVLEFLGDSVLGFVLVDFLCATFPDLNEGELSKMKSTMASTSALHEFAQKIKLDKVLRLGKGEVKSGGRKKRSILAGAYEALIAAIYLDGGIEEVRRFLLDHFGLFLRKIKTDDFIINNYKSALQEHLQKGDIPAPVYRTMSTRGPDHQKQFVVEVFYKEKRLAKAKGNSKKDAEQKAAQRAFKRLFGRRIKSLTPETFLYSQKKE
jgi:ribonuclease-3